jgi:hypothetical protein
MRSPCFDLRSGQHRIAAAALSKGKIGRVKKSEIVCSGALAEHEFFAGAL